MNDCDLVLVTQPNDEFANLIAQSTSPVNDYSHVGLIVMAPNQISVIHATPRRGVLKQSLSDFRTDFADCKLDLYRVQSPFDASVIKQKAEQRLGYPYNPTFLPHAAGFYCSQLITTVFAGVHAFQLTPLSFGADDRVFSHWVKYYQEYNLAVPTDALGSSPNSLVNNGDVEFIQRLQ